jgi:hypothetical protein
MSSGRRGGNDESILAMLERDAGRGGRSPGSRLALYGAGAVLAGSLVGALVWLARDQNADEVVMAEAPVAVQAEATPASARHAIGVVAQQSTPQAALIVDEPQPPAKAPQQHDVPPLVLLAPPQPAQQAATAHASEPLPFEAKPAAQAAPAASAKTAPAGKTAAPSEARPKAKASTTVATEPKHAGKTAAAGHKDSARPHSHSKADGAPAHPASQKAPARPPAKPKKQPAPPQPARTVDSDVALISAVIQHANNRAGAAEVDCGEDAKCAAKATPGE